MATTRAAARLALLASLAFTLSCSAGKLFDAPGANVIAVTPSQVAVLASPTASTWSSSLAISTTGPDRTSPWSARLVAPADWLTLANSSGTAPDTLRVAFNPAGLAPGTYQDTIAIASSEGAAPQVRVPVELNIAAPPPAPPPPPAPVPPPPPPSVETSLVFTTNPPAVLVLDKEFTVVVTARDAQGQTVTGYAGSVKVTLQGPIVSGGLTGQNRVTAVGGVATFTNLKVTGICTGCKLGATATGLTNGTSTAFNVVAK
jgi:hypothetical protein